MRLLYVHAERLRFEAKRVANREGAEREVPTEGEIDGGVAAFLAVERGDLADPAGVAADAAAELRAVARELNADRIALYPFPHLSESPADAADAGRVLRRLAGDLREDHGVVRAPVGWDTAVEVAWKGHPTSEGSRRITPGEDGDPAPESEWVVALPDGGRVDPETALEAVDGADRDALGSVLADPGAALVGPDTPADAGHEHLRDRGLAAGGTLTPRGTFLRDALLSYARDVALSVGATPVGTPRAVDLGEAAIRAGLDAAGRDPVGLATDGAWALAPDGDLGVLSTLAGAAVPPAAFPVKRYARGGSVPRPPESEGDGEVPVRWVSSPRIAVLDADLAAARGTLGDLLARVREVGSDLELDLHPVVRVSASFRDAHPEIVSDVLSGPDAPVPVEVFRDGSGADRALAVEFGVADGEGRFLPGPAVRLDAATPRAFGIEREDGGDPVLVSAAPVGDVECTMAALAAERGRERPAFPAWLSPTQVRLVPVADEHRDRCSALADDLEGSGVRVDVDDRPLPVAERIDRAAGEWVPYTVVVGDRDREGADLDVAVRASGRELRLSPAELAETVRAAVGDRPSLPRTLPGRLADRFDAAGTR